MLTMRAGNLEELLLGARIISKEFPALRQKAPTQPSLFLPPSVLGLELLPIPKFSVGFRDPSSSSFIAKRTTIGNPRSA
jgi:hypothetical protein